MRHATLAFALSLAASLPAIGHADELILESDTTAATSPELPPKGQLSSVVLKHFGEPQKKYAPVGGDSPKHPPITRWDYAGFSVFFENNHVVDAVVPGRPAQVFHTESLKPVAATP